jgi:hypothetical protein
MENLDVGVVNNARRCQGHRLAAPGVLLLTVLPPVTMCAWLAACSYLLALDWRCYLLLL